MATHLSQTLVGKSNTIFAYSNTAADITALAGLLEGEVTTWDAAATQPTTTTTLAYPTELNKKVVQIGDTSKAVFSAIYPKGIISTKSNVDLDTWIKANLDPSKDVAGTVDFVNFKYDKVEA